MVSHDGVSEHFPQSFSVTQRSTLWCFIQVFSFWHIQCAKPKSSKIHFPNLQSQNFHLTFTLWTPVPHHLYKFPLILTTSSCVIFNQRKLLNALESLVALQYRTESNQAGGRRDRKRWHHAKQQTTQSAEKWSGEVKKGESSWLQDVRNLSPPP